MNYHKGKLRKLPFIDTCTVRKGITYRKKCDYRHTGRNAALELTSVSEGFGCG